MNSSIANGNENHAPSLFQLAAHLEDFVAAGGLNQLAPEWSQTSLPDWLRHPEELAAFLKSATTGKGSATARLSDGSKPARGATQTAKSRKREAPHAGDPGSRSPDELRTVEFSLTAPGASSVQLAADFTGWAEHPVEMMPSPEGIWSASVPLPPGNYAYRFLVDGEWRDDPRCTRRLPNPFGTENAVILVE